MSNLFTELKRRNVFRVTVAYLVIGWLVLQVANILIPLLDLSPVINKFIFLILLLGFIPIVLFSWVYERTPVENSDDENMPDTRASSDPHSSPAITSNVKNSDQPIIEKSIAVLPFVNMSPDQEQEYFSDGLTESLLHLLAQVKELRVAARTSSFRFKNHNADIGEIGQQLHVAHILEGSVQRSGPTLRITAQLIKVADGFHIWSGSYDFKIDDIFKIQDKISQEVVETLKITLLGKALSGGTSNTAAYDAYILGLQKLHDGSYVTLPVAEKQFNAALLLDADYVLALNALGETYTQMGNTGLITLIEAGDRIEPVAKRILALDNTSGVGHLLHGLSNWVRHLSHPEYAADDFQRALELAPKNEFVAHWVSTYYNYIGQSGDAIETLEQALQINPLCSDIHNKLSKSYTNLYNNDKAIFHSQTSSQLQPGNPNATQGLEIVYNRTSQFDKAISLLKATELIDPDDYELPATIALNYLALGMLDEARTEIKRATDMQADGFMSILAQMNILYLQDKVAAAVELALDAIRKGLQQRGYFSNLFIRIIGHHAIRENDPDIFLSHIPQWQEIDLGEASIVSQVQYESKVYAVPLLRMAGRDNDADRIIESASHFREKTDSIDIGGFELAVARQNTEDTLTGIQWLLKDGVFRDWFLYLDNAQLDFVKDDSRYKKIIANIEKQLAPLKKTLKNKREAVT
jgi:TolB-like protein